LVVILGLAAFSVGAGCLALALYMWFGAWPQSLRETLDYYRSVAATEGRPPPPNALVDPLLLGESAISAGMIPRNVRAQAPSDLIEFSFEGGLALEVPGDWNTQHDRLFFYEGPIWYQRVFEHRRDPERRVFLWFGAANYRASVFVNGRRVGGHEGGFTPFNFEIGELLRDGENLLVVMVDNTHTPEDIPVRRHDWLNYGGLTRDVLLLDLPATFIRNYAVELDPGDGQRIRGWVQLDGDRLRQDVMIAIPELGAEATVTSDADGRARFELAATPERWSPRSPKLYRIELRSETDAVSDGIGFRSVTVRGRDLLLNGETIFLRGISIHEEKPGPDGGRAHSEAHAEALLGWAQELGCNFVRLAHYTHNEHMVRLADRLGLLVWAEIPVYWNVAFDEPRTLERARTQLSEMIARDRNRASVILWSIGNETPVSDERNAFMKALADHVRALDATRPITAALLAGPRDVGRWALRDVLPSAAGLGRERWEYRVGDPLGAIVDVAALNEYFGHAAGRRDTAHERRGTPADPRAPARAAPPHGSGQAAHRQRVRRRRPGRPPRAGRRAGGLQRGVPGTRLPPTARDALPAVRPARPLALGAEGLPLPAAPAPDDPGPLEPQGPPLRHRPAQAGLRGAAAALPVAGRGNPRCGGRVSRPAAWINRSR
jgi:beta-glucuronidase